MLRIKFTQSKEIKAQEKNVMLLCLLQGGTILKKKKTKEK